MTTWREPQRRRTEKKKILNNDQAKAIVALEQKKDKAEAIVALEQKNVWVLFLRAFAT